MASQGYTESLPDSQLDYFQEPKFDTDGLMKVMVASDIHLGKQNNQKLERKSQNILIQNEII